MPSVDFKFDKAKLQTIAEFLSVDHSVKVGVLGSSEKGNYPGIDAVELASVHEFGSQKRNIPSRSFLRKTMVNNENKFKSDLSRSKNLIFQKIANGQGDVFLNEAGAKWVGWVQETFYQEGPGWPPHSKRYARFLEINDSESAKGNKTEPWWPLLRRTGALLRSITHEVVS